MKTNNFKTFLQTKQQQINQTLTELLPNTDLRLDQAMRYAVLNGGKRIRPLLVYATGEIFKVPQAQLNYAAAAIELIHCYSLVHDDLPAMDNDDLRRGKPTCHKAYDEATAVLVGDALQSLAFTTLANCPTTPTKILKMTRALADAAGVQGMAGGQAIDLAATGKQLNLLQLEKLHRLKTGALIAASVQLGSILGNCNTKKMLRLIKFADQIGLAFQIQDDILDVESSTEELGKKQGADQALNKPTFVSMLGLPAAKKYLNKTHQTALLHLTTFSNKKNNLDELANYIIKRNY